jgi:hypothetical protein
LRWIPNYININENEKADQAAKNRTKLLKLNLEKYMLIIYIKRNIREKSLEK